MTIISRAKNILLQPKSEWEVIHGEASSKGSLYLSYVLPLAAIGPIASFLGMSAIGLGPLGTSMQYGVSEAIVMFIMAICSVLVVAFVIDSLATTFQGKRDSRQALKLAAYSFTPSWLGGVLMVSPALAGLSLLAGLYAVYLLYLGLPVLMESPRDKALPYTGAVVAVAIVAQLILGGLTGAILGSPWRQPSAATQAKPGWSMLTPTEQESLQRLAESARKMQADQQRRHEEAE